MSEITPTFQGEMQLAGWSETHNGGCKVTFWLPDATDLEAFRALTVRKGNQAGHRFMAVLVELGDDERPAQPPSAPSARNEQKGGPLAKLAGMWSSSQDFWLFLRAQGLRCESEGDAAQIIRSTCHIESRAELDHNEEAARIFHQRIRQPFIRWHQGAR
ncbi:hypothetical protein [Burkholderia multivorans]|uniref:hypothetical protein n=1 Tax=Burkholderia multivorans TaxID=87883 RepID=UPI001C23EC8D|nr:hypothetical protein [Burkholderia multivorans]ULR75085.1 hypothetical protein JC1_13 [Burkholderia phage JC1]MBU9386600.1 hypothetical protein [Burkholderia multivorans]MBU9437033.1 hypothetical protein [Burkholderia multivorans]MBU9606240.1 hypothetical protein [Burkholderia multivorans]MBU9624799.1 hypothetical protein [Burkholderia multivorans]